MIKGFHKVGGLPASGWFHLLSLQPSWLPQEGSDDCRHFEVLKNRRCQIGGWQGSTEKLITPTWINPDQPLRIKVLP
jgi:hypothetical protein